VVISELRPGTQARLKIYRDGAAKTLTATLGDLGDLMGAKSESVKPSDNDSAVAPVQADALDGVQVQDLTPRLRRQLHTPVNFAGALILDVDSGSNSYDAGLRTGDVIQEVNRQPVTDAKDAVRLCKAATSPQIVVKIWRLTPNGATSRYLSVDNTKRSK
jgi:serine protease Do